MYSLAFLAGDVFLQTFSHLPDKLWLYFLIFIGLLAATMRRCLIYFMLAFLFGFIYAAWYASSILAWTLPKAWEGRDVMVKGYVASLPVADRGGVNFIFALDELNYQGQANVFPVLIRLSWHTSKQLSVGDGWQLPVRLKRIHTSQNPGAIDFEAFALQKQLRATGRVLNNQQSKRLSHHAYVYPIDHLRQLLHVKIDSLLPNSSTGPWLMALMFGERQGVNPQDWKILRNTGTNHLMAIGGLHIGVLAAIIYCLMSWCWRRLPVLMHYLPAQLAASTSALCVALVYAALSGFAIPAQRASIMLCILIFFMLLRCRITAWQVWSLSLFVVLILNPLMVLSESFWLSFSTIGLIIYGMRGRLAPAGWWWQWGRVQWVIGFGLIPFSLFFFQQASLNSFLANSIAIPWLEFFILPFCLLSLVTVCISSTVTTGLLWLADKSLTILWKILAWFAQYDSLIWIQAVPHFFILFLSLIGIVILLLPIGMKGRWLGVIWLMPLICYQPEKPKVGDVWLTLLDVGQGLSVVVQTAKHVLVFDAGPRSQKMDAGESVILPYLHQINARQIDMLVISHADNDHRGGAAALLNALPVKAIKTSVPEKFSSLMTSYCLANMRWQWDGVSFEFLSPYPDTLRLGNNSSCVLKISNRRKAILLTGDIEQEAEQRLLQRSKALLAADIVVAPHHGSKTSSTEDFVKSIHPHYVLYATGYVNRYYFPHASVIDNYRKVGAVQLNTVDTGAILMQVAEGRIQVKKYREESRKYWWD